MVALGLSEEDALLLGVAHEINGQMTGAPTYGSVDSRIDMNNNRAGIAIGLRARGGGTPNPAALATALVSKAVNNGGCLDSSACFDLSHR